MLTCFKKVLRVKEDKKFGVTEVTIRVPGFHNFGKRMGQIEQEAFEASEDVPVDPKTEEMLHMFDLGIPELQQKIDLMPEGINKQVMRSFLMQRKLGLFGEDYEDAATEEDRPIQKPRKHDLLKLEIVVPKDMKWNQRTDRIVDKFLVAWPDMRSRVLKASFACYKKVYANWLEIYGPPTGGLKITMPQPTTAEALGDYFRVERIYLHRIGNVGLGGSCTWDPEHGYGALLRGEKVVAVGHADEAF